MKCAHCSVKTVPLFPLANPEPDFNSQTKLCVKFQDRKARNKDMSIRGSIFSGICNMPETGEARNPTSSVLQGRAGGESGWVVAGIRVVWGCALTINMIDFCTENLLIHTLETRPLSPPPIIIRPPGATPARASAAVTNVKPDI